jgi:hypothetical protein
MFTIKLQDRKGNPLNEGDIVKISDGKAFTFFAEVKFLEKEGVIAPFHTFSFHSFERVDKVPDNAIKSKEEQRYDIWYVYSDEAEKDENANDYENYLLSWRECERLMDSNVFKIVKQRKC